MMKKKKLLLPINALMLVFLLWVTAFDSLAQTDSIKLSNKEINRIIYRVDTLKGGLNYHVLLKPEENGTFQVHIWINDRLGDNMFKKSGLNICRFYTFNKSKVFVYEDKQCQNKVPPKYMVNTSSEPYAYLAESPFFAENGFYRGLLVKKSGSSLQFKKIEIMDDDLKDKLKDFLEF